MAGSGTTQSAPPALTSSPGMPQTTAVSSASAIVLPPCACSSAMAAAPSDPMPVIRTPTSWLAEVVHGASHQPVGARVPRKFTPEGAAIATAPLLGA